MAPPYLAGMFSRKNCFIKLYNEQYSGHLKDFRLIKWPDMVILTGLNTAYDRMLHISAYVRTNNSKAIIVAGGSAIRALANYSINFYRKYRKSLTGFQSAVAFNNLPMLAIPNLTSAFTDVPAWSRPIWSGHQRSFLGYLEPEDSAYKPIFKVDAAYQLYFRPTMITNAYGELSEELVADLGPGESEKN